MSGPQDARSLKGVCITRMDGQGRCRETGLRSHLEMTASIKTLWFRDL